MSASAASSRWAARRRPLATTLSAAIHQAVPPRLRAPPREAGPVGQLQHLLLVGRKVARIVIEAESILVRDLVARDQVDLAQFERVEMQGARRVIDQPFDHIGGFGPTGTA